MIKYFLVVAFFISFISIGQSDTIKTKEKLSVDFGFKNNETKKEWLNHTPSQELMLYSKHRYTGIILTSISPIFILVSNRVNGGFYINEPLTFLGFLVGAVGLGFNLYAPIHIKRAGILMNQNGIGIKVDL